MYKKGISLLALIITVAVLIIIAVITIPKGIQRSEQAEIAKHNMNISTIQDEVESYYYYNGESLPVVDLTPYPVHSDTSLQNEIVKDGEQLESFYVLDMSKLSKVGIQVSNSPDDIYIVSSIKHTVYYVKGITIKRFTWHGLVNLSETSEFLASETEVTITLSPSPTPVITGLTVTPTPVVTPETSPTPSSTLTPTIAPTLTPTATSIPTSTPTPIPTSTPIPTATPTPTPVPNGAFNGTLNSPKLASGMTAVKWDGSNWVNANTSNTGNDWYDYTKGVNKWANAKLADGSLLVWIPRYTYQIASGEHTATAGTINIRFSNGTTDDTSSSYRVQPAFYWGGWNIPANAVMTQMAGGVEVTGIWVAKFEASSNNGLTGTSGDRIRILPGVNSWIGFTAGDSFTKTMDMQDTYYVNYGISSDRAVMETHLIKNAEWGAIAYLSEYGLGSSIAIATNSSSPVYAGGGSGTAYSTNTTQSTTQNIYGIYDMSGGEDENMAGYVNNGSTNIATYGASLQSAANKYKEVFPVASTDSIVNDYALLNYTYGLAIYETSSGTSSTPSASSWFGDYSFGHGKGLLSNVYPFLSRGGAYNDSTKAGIFGFYGLDGKATTNNVTRVVIVVE